MRALIIALMVAGCATPKPLTRGERAERKARKIEAALNSAEGFLEAAQPQAAEAPLSKAESLLSEPILEAYPDRFFLRERLDKAKEAKKVIVAQLKQREREAEIERQKEQVDDIVKRLQEGVGRLKQTGAEATKFEFEEAERLLGELDGALKVGAEMEPESKAYSSAALRARRSKKRAQKVVQRVSRIVAFREEAVRAHQEGADLMSQARGVRDKRERRAMYKQARIKFLACAKEGGAMLKRSPALRKVRFFVGAKKTSPKKVVRKCKKKARTAKRKMRR